MGYSPWGRKESDTTERLHYLLNLLTEFRIANAVVFPIVIMDVRVEP